MIKPFGVEPHDWTSANEISTLEETDAILYIDIFCCLAKFDKFNLLYMNKLLLHIKLNVGSKIF